LDLYIFNVINACDYAHYWLLKLLDYFVKGEVKDL
jgi:hypothetical protein